MIYYMNYTFDRLRLQVFFSPAPAPLHIKIGLKGVKKHVLPSHLYTGSGPKSTGSDRLRQTAYEYNIKKGHTYREGGAAGRRPDNSVGGRLLLVHLI